MVETVQAFMSADWKKMARKDKTFTERRQEELRNVMNTCARDTDTDMLDTEHENFAYFALCLKTNVASNPILN